MNHLQANTPTAPDRRQFFGRIGLGTVGLAAGGSLLSACSPRSANHSLVSDSAQEASAMASAITPFYGDHQAGIITPAQRHVYFLVLDLHTQNLSEIQAVFKGWTQSAYKLTLGQNVHAYDSNPHVPPTDTGEADSLNAYNLTLTFGVSPSFLTKLGLSSQAPAELVDLPLFPRDQIRKEFSGGDICIQACADDPQVAFHAVRQLVRQARNSVTMKWSQMGFNSFDHIQDTPRNLFGFRDGTANQETLKNPNQHIWADAPGWMQGGSYLVARKIQMHLETWDRTSLTGQEETFARKRPSGAALGSATNEFESFDVNAKDSKGELVIPDISHLGLAKRTGMQLLRRSYSYASGIDPVTGQFDAGLLFISFQKSPGQFIAVQSAFGRIDKMNEYVTHIGSGLFACFGGIKEGQYIGQSLLEARA